MTGEEKKLWVGWFVNFLNADIPKLPPMEEGRMGSDISLILASQAYSADLPPDDLIFGDGVSHDKKFLREWRSYWRNNQYKMMDMQKIQDHLKQFFKDLMQNIQGLPGEDKDCPLVSVSLPITVILKTDTLPANSKDESAKKDLKLSISFHGSSQEDTLLLFFIRVLEGIPLRSFGSCEECAQWFIQLSNKKKQFCSPRCAARAGMREGRKRKRIEASTDENKRMEREQELQKRAERAHIAYAERVKKSHANAKVERRPTKYRKEN